MSKWVSLGISGLYLAVALHSAGQEPKKSIPPDVFFAEPPRVIPVELEISPGEYEAMQPPAVAFGPPGGPPPPTPVPAVQDNRPRETNQFGMQFPLAEAKFAVADQSARKVSIRYAGDITYFASAQGLKRPFRIQFDRSEEAIEGFKALHFHSMPLDPAKAREVLALNLFNAIGVASPRATFAEVTLTVPGRFDRVNLGLFTLVEEVDDAFVKRQFGSDAGLLMKPRRIRGIDFLGDSWNRYVFQYSPVRPASDAESARVIAFAKLIHQASDEEFRQQIGSYLDVDAFLRFTAASALVVNLESFHALGGNYSLYLEPQTQRFVFIPGDLEFSFANFLLFGTPDQLMDLSLMKAYPGENKLCDRLLAIPEIRQRYRELLVDLTAAKFTRERISREAEHLEQLTREARAREADATQARREPPPFNAPGPQAPDLRVFAEKRVASVQSQLKGQREGFIPQPFSFGPPGGGQTRIEPIDEATFRSSVQAPPGFDVTLYAAPPRVNSPVAISAGPSGEIYVAVDQQGSLGRAPGGGRIVRCIDRDRDGRVDDVTTFAKVEHPRGVVYRAGSVWVMHPPTLSVFHDDDADGIADREEVLVTGLTTNQINDRGGDHTTNGVRLGTDGWLYIGVGDYGIKEAKGKDGRTIVLRGGGIVRVRPDGNELEIFCTGLRNPFDIAIDPFLDLFTRDNTNDGAGWDTRVSHLMQTAKYGYTQLFANFTDETMPTLGAFGGGGGTGSLFIQDPRWPDSYNSTLYTGDWGRSEVYRHELRPNGPTFTIEQDVFLKIPRATGMDIDADGRLYVASWFRGDASVDVGPNVGFVAQVAPKQLTKKAFPDLKALAVEQLIDLLAAPESAVRFHTQGEVLRRGKSEAMIEGLRKLAADSTRPLEGRAIATFTLKQLAGSSSHETLVELSRDPSIREFAFRALTDRSGQLDGLDPSLFTEALKDESPRVRAQAVISLGRISAKDAASHLIPLTSRPSGSELPAIRPVQNQPDPDRVIPHLAVQTLVSMQAIDACLEAIEGPHWSGALWALRSMHDPKSVDGLIKKLNTIRDSDRRRAILAALVRLYYREADYTGSWWGIRPDSTGPYYERAEWVMTPRIRSVLTAAYLDANPENAAFLRKELERHQVAIAAIPKDLSVPLSEPEKPIEIAKVDPNNSDQIGNMSREIAAKRTLDANGVAERGKSLFKAQSCSACHTDADGQTPKGPHLVDIGKRARPEELVESLLQPSAKLAQGYESYAIVTNEGRTLTGFIVSESADSIQIRDQTAVQTVLKKSEIDERVVQRTSVMPEGIVNNLTPEQLADLIAYLQSLTSGSASPN